MSPRKKIEDEVEIEDDDESESSNKDICDRCGRYEVLDEIGLCVNCAAEDLLAE